MYKLTQTETVIRLSDSASIPPDPSNSDYARYLDWLGQGNTPAQADQPDHAQIIAGYESALDEHLDAVARQYRYNDRFTFALRAGYAGPYHDEAVAFAQWMDGCNVQAFALLADVVAGNAPMPTVEAFIAGLPEFALP